MATLRKLKLLALLLCASAETSSSPRPSQSPLRCFNFRRRLSLRRLLSRRFYGRKNLSVDQSGNLSLEGLLITSHKLKDLFVSSPPPKEKEGNDGKEECVFGSLMDRIEEYPVRQRRFGLGSLRFRLLRGGWRPRLVAIPE